MTPHTWGRDHLLCLLLVAPLAACGTSDPANLPGPGGENAIALHDMTVTTAEDTPVTMTIAFTASDPSSVVLRVAQGPGHGSIATRNATWTYTPAGDFAGDDNVIILAEDARGASHGQATAALAITVTPVNDAPIAGDVRDSFSTTIDAALTISRDDLLDHASDADGDPLTLAGVAAVTGGHGAPAIRGSDVVFTPEAGFEGTAAFTYTVSDGQATATATASIAVTQKPHAAPVVGNDVLTVDEAAEITIDDATLLANDRDPEGLPLTISQVMSATASGQVVASATHSGTQTTIKPFQSFYGVAVMSYLVSNGFRSSLALVTLTIKPQPLTTDVELTLGSGTTSVRAGGSVQYFLFVDVAGNHGVDVTVTDSFPPELTCSWRCQPDLSGADRCASTGTGNLRDAVHLGGPGGVTYAIDCTVSAQTTATAITNTASLTVADWITDTAPANNTGSHTFTVTH